MTKPRRKIDRKTIERLRDIVDAMDKIDFLVAKFSFDHIAEHFFYYDSLVRNLEIIGEASHHLPKTFKAQHPKIPWQKMKDVRNILAHEYYRIDLRILYNIAKNRLPKLRRIIVKLLPTLEK